MVPTSFCSIDGVDFKILEPKPLSLSWFNHQFHEPGLRYKIALSIRADGYIVWAQQDIHLENFWS